MVAEKFDRGRVGAGTKSLSDLVASRVLADFINSDCMATVMYLECHLSALEDRHFFR
jgi:hypothetical protein